MEQIYSVREVADQLGKSEETIKRWIRSGQFPNATKENDKTGWKIPQSDIQNLTNNTTPRTNHTSFPPSYTSSETTRQDERECVSLAYQAVTMTMPTEKILDLLSPFGIKRVLEILLVMRQSPQKVKNPEGFIIKAIEKNWSPTTIPIKMPRKQSNPVRQEILPDWFDEYKSARQAKEEKKVVSEEEKKEVEELLKSFKK